MADDSADEVSFTPSEEDRVDFSSDEDVALVKKPVGSAKRSPDESSEATTNSVLAGLSDSSSPALAKASSPKAKPMVVGELTTESMMGRGRGTVQSSGKRVVRKTTDATLLQDMLAGLPESLFKSEADTNPFEYWNTDDQTIEEWEREIHHALSVAVDRYSKGFSQSTHLFNDILDRFRRSKEKLDRIMTDLNRAQKLLAPQSAVKEGGKTVAIQNLWQQSNEYKRRLTELDKIEFYLDCPHILDVFHLNSQFLHGAVLVTDAAALRTQDLRDVPEDLKLAANEILLRRNAFELAMQDELLSLVFFRRDDLRLEVLRKTHRNAFEDQIEDYEFASAMTRQSTDTGRSAAKSSSKRPRSQTDDYGGLIQMSSVSADRRRRLASRAARGKLEVPGFGGSSGTSTSVSGSGGGSTVMRSLGDLDPSKIVVPSYQSLKGDDVDVSKYPAHMRELLSTETTAAFLKDPRSDARSMIRICVSGIFKLRAYKALEQKIVGSLVSEVKRIVQREIDSVQLLWHRNAQKNSDLAVAQSSMHQSLAMLESGVFVTDLSDMVVGGSIGIAGVSSSSAFGSGGISGSSLDGSGATGNGFGGGTSGVGNHSVHSRMLSEAMVNAFEIICAMIEFHLVCLDEIDTCIRQDKRQMSLLTAGDESAIVSQFETVVPHSASEHHHPPSSPATHKRTFSGTAAPTKAAPSVRYTKELLWRTVQNVLQSFLDRFLSVPDAGVDGSTIGATTKIRHIDIDISDGLSGVSTALTGASPLSGLSPLTLAAEHGRSPATTTGASSSSFWSSLRGKKKVRLAEKDSWFHGVGSEQMEKVMVPGSIEVGGTVAGIPEGGLILFSFDDSLAKSESRGLRGLPSTLGFSELGSDDEKKYDGTLSESGTSRRGATPDPGGVQSVLFRSTSDADAVGPSGMVDGSPDRRKQKKKKADKRRGLIAMDVIDSSPYHITALFSPLMHFIEKAEALLSIRPPNLDDSSMIVTGKAASMLGSPRGTLSDMSKGFLSQDPSSSAGTSATAAASSSSSSSHSRGGLREYLNTFVSGTFVPEVTAHAQIQMLHILTEDSPTEPIRLARENIHVFKAAKGIFELVRQLFDIFSVLPVFDESAFLAIIRNILTKFVQTAHDYIRDIREHLVCKDILNMNAEYFEDLNRHCLREFLMLKMDRSISASGPRPSLLIGMKSGDEHLERRASASHARSMTVRMYDRPAITSASIMKSSSSTVNSLLSSTPLPGSMPHLLKKKIHEVRRKSISEESLLEFVVYKPLIAQMRSERSGNGNNGSMPVISGDSLLFETTQYSALGLIGSGLYWISQQLKAEKMFRRQKKKTGGRSTTAKKSSRGRDGPSSSLKAEEKAEEAETGKEEKEEQPSDLDQTLIECGKLSEQCVSMIRIELRSQCVMLLSNIAENNYWLHEPSSRPEEFVIVLNKLLIAAENALNECLPSHFVKFVFVELTHFIARVIIYFIPMVESRKINSNGYKQLWRNIFSLQQNLTTITQERQDKAFDRAQRYLALSQKKPGELDKLQKIDEEKPVHLRNFSTQQYSDIKRVAKLSQHQTRS